MADWLMGYRTSPPAEWLRDSSGVTDGTSGWHVLDGLSPSTKKPLKAAFVGRRQRKSNETLRICKGYSCTFCIHLYRATTCRRTLTSATIVGTVTDSAGAVIPNAAVRVIQDGSNAVISAVTGSSGEYRFPFLKPGDYTITAEGTGLETSSTHLHLLIGQVQAVNLTLGLQSAQQSIEVEASQTLLQTENGNQVTSYSEDYVKNIPVNGGDITNVAYTTPGIRLNVGGGNANFNVNGSAIQRGTFYDERDRYCGALLLFAAQSSRLAPTAQPTSIHGTISKQIWCIASPDCRTGC
jgi:hypothetical protein